jgi:hypothetical protein
MTLESGGVANMVSTEVVGCAALIRAQKRGTGRKHLRGLQPDRVVMALRRKMEQEKTK